MRGIFGDIYLDAFFGAISDNQKAYKLKKMREDNEITVKDGYDGVERLNIPHIYTSITVSNGFLYCIDKKGLTNVYNDLGVTLFIAENFYYCGRFSGDGMFLVEDLKYKGYALLKGSEVLTDYIFKPYRQEKFNEHGFMLVHDIFETWSSSVINLSGEIIYEGKRFQSPYIYGVILSDEKGYFNLLTQEYICTKGYHSLSTDDFIFNNTERNCVYQINKNDGTFVIHGKEDESKRPLTEAKQKEKDDAKAKQDAERKVK